MKKKNAKELEAANDYVDFYEQSCVAIKENRGQKKLLDFYLDYINIIDDFYIRSLALCSNLQRTLFSVVRWPPEYSV